MKSKSILLLTVVMLLVSMNAFAQRRRGGWRSTDISDASGRNGVPRWDVDEGFESDTFTFARVRYSSYYGGGRRGGGGWSTDYPDSDLNFSLRLQQLTSLKVNPDPVILDLINEDIFDYPFLYMIEPGALYFEESEVRNLRRYLMNGVS